MTSTEIQIAIAERCGLDQSHLSFHDRRYPPYTTDLNSIRDAVLEQSEAFQREFHLQTIWCMAKSKNISYANLSALDWAQCFLAAWEAMEK